MRRRTRRHTSLVNQSVDEDAIRDFCRHRQLARPEIGFRKAAGLAAMAMVLALSLSALIHLRTGFAFLYCFDSCLGLIFVCSAKFVLLFSVKCYQRYAPESLRRQCSCVPSCSEYALQALEKHIWPKAVWKIWRRVTHTCMSPGYHIDYI
ncbi:membrane protein insertion efficiency factor YidD [bacterium]|nr:membrane protein insertion efficiency factor YidD [bacterium]